MKKIRNFGILAISLALAVTFLAWPVNQSFMKTEKAFLIEAKANPEYSANTTDPNMQAALTYLRQAKASLGRAAIDKGGHRDKALRSVTDAIAEVERGMAYERAH